MSGLAAANAERFAAVGLGAGSPNFGGCSDAADNVWATTFDASAGALTDAGFYIWFED